MTHERTIIRHYAVDLLKRNVEVGGRVYANRPSAVFLHELPMIVVSFTRENIEPYTGDKYNPVIHERTLSLAVDILCEEPALADGQQINTSPSGDDELDRLGEQVERAFFADHTFAKNLPGYDPDKEYDSLLMGMRLEEVVPFEVETEAERRVLGQRLVFGCPYAKDVTANIRWPALRSYYVAFVAPGSDETTVDRVLTAAQGEFK